METSFRVMGVVGLDRGAGCLQDSAETGCVEKHTTVAGEAIHQDRMRLKSACEDRSAISRMFLRMRFQRVVVVAQCRTREFCIASDLCHRDIDPRLRRHAFEVEVAFQCQRQALERREEPRLFQRKGICLEPPRVKDTMEFAIDEVHSKLQAQAAKLYLALKRDVLKRQAFGVEPHALGEV